MSKLLLACIISLCILSTSCGEYEQLERTKVLVRLADSLYSTKRDSLRKIMDSNCDEQYQSYYESSLDSIKSKQIAEIRDLIE